MNAGHTAAALTDTPCALDDRYELLEPLGSGGWGQVYLARHLELGHRVAIKVLTAQRAEVPAQRKRFLQEARASARLESDHVVQVVDVGEADLGPYFVMELLQGMDLAELLRQCGPQSIEVSVDYILQACAGVAAAHEHGVVHRDIKPGNLFLTRSEAGNGERIKVLDFGISKQLLPDEEEAALTTTAGIIGSPRYMAPEQMDPQLEMGTATDVWGLTVTLHELLTGKLPFSGETLPKLSAAILHMEPVALREHLPHAPEELEAILLRCLTKRPDARISSVTELAQLLAPFASESGRAGVAQLLSSEPAGVSFAPSRPATPRAAPSETTLTTDSLALPALDEPEEPAKAKRRPTVALGAVAAGALLFGTIAFVTTQPEPAASESQQEAAATVAAPAPTTPEPAATADGGRPAHEAADASPVTQPAATHPEATKPEVAEPPSQKAAPQPTPQPRATPVAAPSEPAEETPEELLRDRR